MVELDSIVQEKEEKMKKKRIEGKIWKGGNREERKGSGMGKIIKIYYVQTQILYDKYNQCG